MALNNSAAHTRHFNSYQDQCSHTYVYVYVLVLVMERKACVHIKAVVVLPVDKAGKLLSTIKDLGLTPCYLSSWVLSFTLDLLL